MNPGLPDRIASFFRSVFSVEFLDRWAILLVFGVHLSFFPYFPGMHSANELSRLYLARALAEDGDVEITPYVRKYGDITDKSAVADSLFSDKPPGTAFFTLPVLAGRIALGIDADLKTDLRLARLAAGILPTLVLLLLLRIEMRELGVSPAGRAFVLATYGLGTLGFTYAVLFYGHQLTAVLLYSAFFLVRHGHRQFLATARPSIGTLSPARSASFGFLCGLCVATEYQAAVYLVPLVVAFLIRSRMKPSSLLAAVGGAIPPVAALLAYHDAAFGGPFRTGYNYLANSFFADVHRQGFMGVLYPKPAAFVGSLFLPSKGLLAWSPVLVLGFVGLVSFWRAVPTRGAAILRTAQVALPILFVSSMVYWDGGWTVSQRHLTPLVPFLLAPMACLLDRSVTGRIVAPGLGAASVMATGLATVVYPHLPESVVNPFHDLTVPLAAGGCLASTPLEPAIPAVVFLAVVAAAFVLLVLLCVALWPGGLTWKVVATLAFVLLPLGWWEGTSRISRLEPDALKEEQSYFIGQCKIAKRWNEVRGGAGKEGR